MTQSYSILNARLPSFDVVVHNGVIVAQALLVLMSPFIRLAGGAPIQDRAMDVIFALYLGVVALKCVFGRPTFRLIAGLALIGAYGFAGLVESYLNQNLGGFVFEAKLFVSLALFFCLLDERPKISDKSLKLLFGSFIVASICFLVLNPGERLHIVNESNYLCMYVGIAMFSYISAKGRTISNKSLIGLGLFTMFLIIVSQSRTGAGFLAVAWLVYFWERYGFGKAALAATILAGVGLFGAVAAIAVDAPIVARFDELRNPAKVDRFIYLIEAGKIIERRSVSENLVRLTYAEPVSTRVADDMKWLTSRSDTGTEQGQLYPHHFHLAYLRLLTGHGFVVLGLFVVALPFVWRHNKYLALGLGVCSLSMSVPYLSLFFGSLQIAMAFPSVKSSRTLAMLK